MTTLARSTFLCLVLAALAGCYDFDAERKSKNAVMVPAPSIERNLYDLPFTVYRYADPDTGCQYLMRDGSSTAMTPRIAADGITHMGCKGAQP